MYKKIPPSLCDNYTKKLFLETGENWVTLRFAPSCWNYIISIRSLFRRVRYIYLYNLYIIWMYAAVQKSSHTSTYHSYSHHPFHSWSVFFFVFVFVFVFGLAHSLSRPFPLSLPLPHSPSLSSLVFFPFCFTQSLSLLRFSFVLFLFACVIARKIKVAYCCKRTDCKRDHWKPATFTTVFKYISVYTIRYGTFTRIIFIISMASTTNQHSNPSPKIHVMRQFILLSHCTIYQTMNGTALMIFQHFCYAFVTFPIKDTILVGSLNKMV